jgi:hypothetical protein
MKLLQYIKAVFAVARLITTLKLTKGESSMALTPNTGVGAIESMAFSAGDLVYATILRDLLIKAIDDPGNIWDDRILAMTDGAFAYKVK